jgi:dTDP-4-dehydrorhamnose reductase
MRILIFGSSGKLGNSIYSELKRNKKFKVFHNGLRSKKFNLVNKKNINFLLKKKKPDIIINASSITDIDYCEKYKKKSFNVNVGIVKDLLDIKKKNNLDFYLIQFSTDHLYNLTKLNSEKDKIFLNNVYCKQKICMEKLCLNNNCLILRTNFFGRNKSNKTFDTWLYKSFKSNEYFYLFDDQFFSPLRIQTISLILKKIIDKKIFTSGIFNLGSKKGMSKKNFAIFFAKKSKIYKKNYKLIKTNNFCKTKRSLKMLMNISKFQKEFNIKLPNLKSEIINEIKYNYLK